MSPKHSREEAPSEVIRAVLDDETVERLRAAARDRDLTVEELIVVLVTAASGRIDELVPRNGSNTAAC